MFLTYDVQHLTMLHQIKISRFVNQEKKNHDVLHGKRHQKNYPVYRYMAWLFHMNLTKWIQHAWYRNLCYFPKKRYLVYMQMEIRFMKYCWNPSDNLLLPEKPIVENCRLSCGVMNHLPKSIKTVMVSHVKDMKSL